jgi:hypothetical protein
MLRRWVVVVWKEKASQRSRIDVSKLFRKVRVGGGAMGEDLGF